MEIDISWAIILGMQIATVGTLIAQIKMINKTVEDVKKDIVRNREEHKELHEKINGLEIEFLKTQKK